MKMRKNDEGFPKRKMAPQQKEKYPKKIFYIEKDDASDKRNLELDDYVYEAPRDLDFLFNNSTTKENTDALASDY